MFLIQDAAGKYFQDKPWKNLLVFFEHGNIADATTYLTLKEQLVAKACTTLSKVLSEVDATAGPLRLEYACSFDDTNCGEGNKALFRPPEDVTILSMLRWRIDPLPEGHVLNSKSGRLILPPRTGPVAANPYSSCCLPGIVEKFYEDLERQMQQAS